MTPQSVETWRPARIRATPMKGRDLKPGDLFSTAGAGYWNQFPTRDSVGERVYLRTNAPADAFPDADEEIYKIEVIYDEQGPPAPRD